MYHLTCPSCEQVTESPFVRSGAVVHCPACEQKYRIKSVHFERLLHTGPRTLDESGSVLRSESVDIDPDEVSPVSIDDDGNVVGLSGLSELMRSSDEQASTRQGSRNGKASRQKPQDVLNARLAAEAKPIPSAVPKRSTANDADQTLSPARQRARRAKQKRKQTPLLILTATLGVLVGGGLVIVLIGALPGNENNDNPLAADQVAQTPPTPPDTIDTPATGVEAGPTENGTTESSDPTDPQDTNPADPSDLDPPPVRTEGEGNDPVTELTQDPDGTSDPEQVAILDPKETDTETPADPTDPDNQTDPADAINPADPNAVATETPQEPADPPVEVIEPVKPPTVLPAAKRIKHEGWYILDPPREPSKPDTEEGVSLKKGILTPGPGAEGMIMLSGAVENSSKKAIVNAELHVMLMDAQGRVFAETYFPLAAVNTEAERNVSIAIPGRHWQRARSMRTGVKVTDWAGKLEPLEEVNVESAGQEANAAVRITTTNTRDKAINGTMIRLLGLDAQGIPVAEFLSQDATLKVAPGEEMDLVVPTPLESDSPVKSWSVEVYPQ